MTFRCPSANPPACALVLALFCFVFGARAQSVILHLRNGDRLAGVILSENTNQLTLSTVWNKELTVPIAQIQSREIPPSPSAATNALITSVPATNVIPTIVTVTNVVATNVTIIVVTNVPGSLARTSQFERIKVPPYVNTNTFWRRWHGDVAVGEDYERGAIDHELYYARAKLTYAQPYASDPKEFFRNVLTYDAEYGKTDDTLSDNRMGGSSKTDFDLTRKWYAYNLGAAFYDEIRKIDLHYEEGPGVGYHWFNGTNFVVNVEAGANYQVEDRSDDTRVASAYFRLGQDLTWKINKQLTLTEKYEYFPRVGYAEQFRMRFESTLNVALTLKFFLNFTIVDVYDTQPASAIPNNDVQVRTTLGVKF